MIDSSIRVGDVVFAGDLVKILRGTKYCYITYYDLDQLNLVLKERAFKHCFLNETSYENFNHWLINDTEYTNGQEIDQGISTDLSAYMYIDSNISVMYVGNGGTTNVGAEQYIDVVDNCTYMTANDGVVYPDTSYNNELTVQLNYFIYTNHRFLGWKKNSIGDYISIGSLLSIKNDLWLYAQWIRQFSLTLRIGDGCTKMGGVGSIDFPTTLSAMYDIGLKIVLSPAPSSHYHLTKWRIESKVETDSGSYTAISDYIPYVYSPYDTYDVNNYILNMNLYNDVTTKPYYAIDWFYLSIYINNPSYGYVEFKNYTESKNLNVLSSYENSFSYNDNFEVVAKSLDNDHKFLTWYGDVGLLRNSTYSNQNINLTLNTMLCAIFGVVNRYSIAYNIYNNSGGRVEFSKSEGIELSGIYREKETATISVIADDLFTIAGITLDGVKKSIASNSTYSSLNINNINSNHIISVAFDTRLIENNGIPIIDDTGIVLDYKEE